MSFEPKLREKPISALPTASFKWFQQTLKFLKGNLLQFYMISMLAPFLMLIATVIIPFIGLAIAYAIYTFYCAVLFKVCLNKSNSQPIGFKDFVSIEPHKIKPLILISIIYFVLSILVSLPVTISLINFINSDPSQFEQLSQLNYQEMILFFENIMIEHPEKTASLFNSFLFLCLGMFLIEAMMFFVPGILIIHSDVNIFSAIKLSFIGILKNSISFIPYGLVLLTIFMFSLFFSIFGFPLFLMLFKISSFAAYQEIFIEPNTSSNSSQDESIQPNQIDSRDF